MKYSIEKERLQQVMETVRPLKKPVRFSTVLPNTGMYSSLTVEGNTLEVSCVGQYMAVRMRCEVAGERDGRIALPTKPLTKIARGLLDGAVDFDCPDGKDVTFIKAADVVDLWLVGSSDFDTVLREFYEPKAESVTEFSVDAASFATAIRQVIVAASEDDAKYAFTGVRMELDKSLDTATLTATDTYRLMQKTIDVSGLSLPPGDSGAGNSVIIPAQTLHQAQAVFVEEGSLSIKFDSSVITISNGDIEISSALIEGDFPNTDSFFSSDQETVFSAVVEVESFQDAIKLASLALKDPEAYVACDFAKGGPLTIHMKDDVGNEGEMVVATLQSSEIQHELILPQKFLVDALHSFDKQIMLASSAPAQENMTAVLRLTDPSDTSIRGLLAPWRSST